MFRKMTKAEKLVLENNDLRRRLAALESDKPMQELKLYYLHRLKNEKANGQKWENMYRHALAANKQLKADISAVNKRWLAERSGAFAAERNAAHAQRMYDQLQKEYQNKLDQNRKLRDRNAELVAELSEKGNEIEALKDKVKELTVRASEDASTTGLPTSQTPINGTKRNPNSRVKTGRHKGGQPGHAKALLKAFAPDETTVTVNHELPEERRCDKCGGKLVPTDSRRKKCEIDYEVKVGKEVHYFFEYVCADCGRTVRVPVPENLKEENQYGPNIQAAIISLLERGCVSTERTQGLVKEMTGGKIVPSIGYIGKMQARAAGYLKDFIRDLTDRCRQEPLLYWDDTVVFLNTRRACLRFYGNERIALYTAHETKGMDGLDEDEILDRLTEQNTVMHDHNKVNYNPKYHFRNIECIEHLLRDLEKDTVNTDNKWAGKLKKLIQQTIDQRKKRCKDGKPAFDPNETEQFQAEVDRCLELGRKENMASRKHYYADTEKTLLERIEEYRANYFAWVYDFSLPVTNNLSERSLRFSKTHQKVSGQFWKKETAQAYAAVQTYIETCRRNDVSEMDAIRRLMEGNPYTVEEVLTARH